MRKRFFNAVIGTPFFQMGKYYDNEPITPHDDGTDPNTKDDPSSAHDPADPENNDLHTPGDGDAGETLNGTQASTSQQSKEDNIDDEWDQGITQFHPWRTPLLSIARRVARKVPIKNWYINHPRVGGDTLDGRTLTDIAAGDSIKLNAKNFSGSLKAFYKNTTIMVPSVPGYKKGSATQVEGGLMLYVTSYDAEANEATCMAVNGPLKSGSEVTEELDCMTVPAIPAGTYMCAGSSAASESQLMITPENYQPRKERFQVQKKLFNLLWTDDFAKSKKKIPWDVKDIKAAAINNYNIRAERTYWYGAQAKFPVVTKDGVTEDVYTTKGIFWQVTNTYSIERGHITLADLVAMSKLQFTTFSQSDHAYAFCGKNFMEWLLNLDLGQNQRIVTLNDVRSLDIDFKQLKTTFGTIDFTYDQGLDALGQSDVCVILDLEGATRYVKTGSKEGTNDMSKGSGEIREAKRFYHYEADGIALRGYNSILVAPTDIAFGFPDTQIRSNVVSSATLPSKPAEGVIVALTADVTVTTGSGTSAATTTYKAGNVYQYTGGAWKEYEGYTNAA